MRRLHYDGSIEVHTRPITRPRDTYNMTQEFSRLLLLRKQDLKLQTDITCPLCFTLTAHLVTGHVCTSERQLCQATAVVVNA